MAADDDLRPGRDSLVPLPVPLLESELLSVDDVPNEALDLLRRSLRLRKEGIVDLARRQSSHVTGDNCASHQKHQKKEASVVDE